MQIVRKDNEQKLAMMQGDRSIANTSTLVSPATSGNEHVGNVNGLVGLFFSNFLKHLFLKGAASRSHGVCPQPLPELQVCRHRACHTSFLGPIEELNVSLLLSFSDRRTSSMVSSTDAGLAAALAARPIAVVGFAQGARPGEARSLPALEAAVLERPLPELQVYWHRVCHTSSGTATNRPENKHANTDAKEQTCHQLTCSRLSVTNAPMG